MKNCPYCAEEVQDNAILCKHCNSKLITSEIKDEPSGYLKWHEQRYDSGISFLKSNLANSFLLILSLVIFPVFNIITTIDYMKRGVTDAAESGLLFSIMALIMFVFFSIVVFSERKNSLSKTAAVTTLIFFWFNNLYSTLRMHAGKMDGQLGELLAIQFIVFLPLVLIIVVTVSRKWNKMTKTLRNLMIGLFSFAAVIVVIDSLGMLLQIPEYSHDIMTSFLSKLSYRIGVVIMIFLSIGSILKIFKSKIN
ncbi:MAG: zinc ribbon domain-containing protein [Bacteroidota bacterium]